jgi:hypothetical protein
MGDEVSRKPRECRKSRELLYIVLTTEAANFVSLQMLLFPVEHWAVAYSCAMSNDLRQRKNLLASFTLTRGNIQKLKKQV